MAQNENYSQVDLRVGTEEQFNAKVGTLPAGTLFGTTDSTVSKADLSTDLKNEINGKINKPANPTSDSAVVINSSGEISTKPLTSITGKAEVAVSSTTPLNDEILWINPDGTSGGGSSGGGKLYAHTIHGNVTSYNNTYNYTFTLYDTKKSTKLSSEEIYPRADSNQAVVQLRVRATSSPTAAPTDYCSLICTTGQYSWGFYEPNGNGYISIDEYYDSIMEL